VKIGTIVEGPTDRLLLEAIIAKLYSGDHVYLPLQPLDIGASFDRSGTGWKGVRSYCFGTDISKLITDYQIDLLIIHLDADAASESDLQRGMIHPVENVSQPCPPILPTAENLEDVIAKWLNLASADNFPSEVILAIPSQDTENWVFAALFPNDTLCCQSDYECTHKGNNHHHPGFLMTLKKYGKKLKRKGNEIKKPQRYYRQISGDVADNWNKVCEFCSQARRFNDELMYKSGNSIPDAPKSIPGQSGD